MVGSGVDVREGSIMKKFLILVLGLFVFVSGCTPVTPTTLPFKGLCFSPYLKGDLNQNITSSTLDNLLGKISPYTTSVRGFGSRDFWPTFYSMSRIRGLTVAAGADIWSDTSSNGPEVAALAGLCQNKAIDFAIVGDETMDDMDGPPALSESQMLSYINQVKGKGVPVGSAQSYYVWEQHPNLVQAVDFIVMNVYPYWNGLSWQDSLNFVKEHHKTISGYGKPVYIETGWPSAGDTNGAAVPSAGNSGSYMSEFMKWAKDNNVNYWYFNSFDEDWKIEEGSVGPYWGVWDHDGNLKPENAKYLTIK